jgi:hypothetical protein
MSLWLEEATKSYLSNLDPRHMPFKKRMALLQKGRTKEHVKRELLEGMFREDAARKNWLEPRRDLLPAEYAECEADLRRRMAPFILPELAHLPIAFDVDAMTVNEFAGADIKPSVADFSRALLRAWRSTYLDFPAGSAKLDDSWFVRAVFITQEACDTSKWSAILQTAPTSPVMVLTWYVRENVGHFPGSLLGYDDDFSLFSSCGHWSECIANLVYLCIARFGTMSAWNNDDRSMGGKGIALLERDRQAAVSALAEPSSFRLERLTSPHAQRLAIRYGATNPAGLSKHIRVRGHFKLVRFGKRRAYRRLTWVRSYERGPRHKPLETRVALFKVAAIEQGNGPRA